MNASNWTTAMLGLAMVFSLPSPAQKARTSKPAITKTQTQRLDKKLSDFGITNRSLGYWKTTGGQTRLDFKEVGFKHLIVGSENSNFMQPRYMKEAWYDKGLELPLFEVLTKDYFATPDSSEGRPEAILRLSLQGPQLSLDQGRHWVLGEQAGTAWRFGMDNVLITLDQADEQFQAAEIKAFAFPKGAVLKYPRYVWGCNIIQGYPIFMTMVMTVAYGKHEIIGTLKFPGTDFVVPFRGIQVGQGFAATTLEARPYLGEMLLKVAEGSFFKSPGLFGGLDSKFLNLYITPKSILIGSAAQLNYAHPDQLVETFASAAEYELATALPLPNLAEAYKKNISRAIWMKSDEEDSYSWAADQAYIQTGKPVAMFPVGHAPTMCNEQERAAAARVEKWSQRIKRQGGQMVVIPVSAW